MHTIIIIIERMCTGLKLGNVYLRNMNYELIMTVRRLNVVRLRSHCCSKQLWCSLERFHKQLLKLMIFIKRIVILIRHGRIPMHLLFMCR